MPVGAKVYIIDNEIFFNGIVLNSNGTQKIEIALHRSLNNAEGIGIEAAKIALDRGAYKLISSAHNG